MSSSPQPSPLRRRLLAAGAVLAGLGVVGGSYWWWVRFPPDTTPEGAYLRIAAAMLKGQPENCFAYLEDEAQHACFTIADYTLQARQTIMAAYPPEAQPEALAPYATVADKPGGPPTWAALAEARGWLRRLRRDLSGIAEVAVDGDRATITTTRGTRYPFRRRDNGIWGLTIFTAELLAEAEKLARDWQLIQAAAVDYRRGRDGAP